ncbi:MAG: arsenosugar biosynthesis radical SAM protein ArsS [Lyngbya sp. HA4199-MV5]|jgi:radical SAM/Cys-rich protein|nr:arsenosugar biosynthesis radical SAM protein ArsS [Lyngbya sp. HA4199-MV5]
MSETMQASALKSESSLDQGQIPATSKTTVLYGRSRLADPHQQLADLAAVDLSHTPQHGNFAETLAARQWQPLQPTKLEIFQINLGKLCNMTCSHCHVDAGPTRTAENMDRATIDACLHALDQTDAHTVDITGGAPEMNPHFRYLVDQCVARGKHVIDRCNLTVLLLPRMQDLPEWLAARGVEIVCSLPHYQQENTDTQRGNGTFEKSITALQRLNTAGYGKGDPQRPLVLVTNPVGTCLAKYNPCIEKEWKNGLQENYGITFDRLIALNNMPISRYLEWLETSGNLQAYMERLVNAFNPGTIAGLMCRNTLSIAWDGRLFDCDFNQMLDLEAQQPNGQHPHIRDFNPEMLAQREIVTGHHCFGCTAGAGSSCSGAIV